MHNHAAAISLLLVTAVVSLALTALAAGAWHRTGNRKLVPVMVAFWTFFAKSALTAYSLHTDAIGHEDLEVLNGLFDLAIVAMLMSPFVAPLLRRSPAA
jgi:hypothetical protein